jgi:hypothetical protein
MSLVTDPTEGGWRSLGDVLAGLGLPARPSSPAILVLPESRTPARSAPARRTGRHPRPREQAA